MTARDAILEEFGCYYLGDELRLDDQFAASIPEMATASAERLARSTDVAAVEALLRELRTDRVHPLHATIGEQTLLSWNAGDVSWQLFGELVDAILSKLQSP